MFKKTWTMWFVGLVTACGLAACGEGTVLVPVDDGQDDGGFVAQTGDDGTPAADSGSDAATDAGQDSGSDQPDGQTSDGSTATDTDAAADTDAGTATDADQTDTQTGGDAATGDAGQNGGETDSGTADAGTPAGDQTTDAGSDQPPANVDVIKVSGSCQIGFSGRYANNALNGEVRGVIPGIANWDAGPAMTDSDADGYLDLVAALPAGTFDLSYLGDGSWAMYGSKEQIGAMSAVARSFIQCNWWDAASGQETAVASPGCNIRIAVAADCTVTGAGNMAGFTL